MMPWSVISVLDIYMDYNFFLSSKKLIKILSFVFVLVKSISRRFYNLLDRQIKLFIYSCLKF